MSFSNQTTISCNGAGCASKVLGEVSNRMDMVTYAYRKVKVLAQDHGWLIQKYAHWCPSCKHLAPKPVPKVPKVKIPEPKALPS